MEPLAAARAADKAGVGFCLSTMSTSTIEDVSKEVRKPIWFQLYVMRDRGLAKSMIERAKTAGCAVLVLTVDLALQGQRDRDVHNGLTIPPKLRWSTLMDFALHPGWVWRFFTGPKVTLANFVGTGHGDDMFTIAEFVNAQFDQSVTWKDIEWAKSLWGGPLALKGILNPEDARRGREPWRGRGDRVQPRRPPAGRGALRDLRAARCCRRGGRQDGSDLGRRRASRHRRDQGISAGSQSLHDRPPVLVRAGVHGRCRRQPALEILRNELDVGLALIGRASVRDLDRSALARTPH